MPRFLTAMQKLLLNATSDTLKQNPQQIEVLHVSQEIRSRLSTQAFVLVLLVAIVYTWVLWERVDSTMLVIWSVAVTITAAHRAWYCRRLLDRLYHQPSTKQLMRNECYLFANGVTYGILIGSAFWLIAAHGDDRTVFSITLMSCMYAIGTTVNSSIHFRSFAVFTLLNLGQGIVFFAMDGQKVDIPIMMTMIVITILLLRFGHRNAELFEESVNRKLENLAQNEQLKTNQRVIERSLDIANQANLSKSRFLASASHDLRQPLHALSLFLGSLKNTKTSKEQTELINYIQQSSDTLTTQFNSLLDLSQYDSGNISINIVNFDLHTMLSQLVDSMSLEANEKKLSLSYNGDPTTLQSDPILIDRMVRNLIGNALKYTDEGSVHISCKPSEKSVVISVSDTGCGIAASDIKTIFEEFTQIDNSSRNISKGAGLGLAIVKRITDLLNIDISVDSKVALGSTFSLRIPLKAHQSNAKPNTIGKRNWKSPAYEQAFQCQNSTAPSQLLMTPSKEATDNANIPLTNNPKLHQTDLSSETFDLHGLNILLVDDDQTVLIAFKQLLIRQGADVIDCISHEKAIEIASPSTIDFAFLDDMLAGPGSGLDIAHWLAGYIDKQRIVLMTGSEQPHRLQQIRSAGFTVYTKPLSMPQLNSIFLSRAKLFSNAQSIS